MKKILICLLLLILTNSICLASSENVSALINKKITINYATDIYEHDYNENGEESYQYATKYKGLNCSFFDANYDEVFPISYEGTTYLPLRAISGMLNIKILWDGTTNTIYLGEGEISHGTINYTEREKILQLEEINVLRNENIKIYYNGELQSFTDANGKIVYPLSYNGTTYLPIRAVANLFDILIDWEADTDTVLIKRKTNSKIFGDKEIKTNLSLLTDEELEMALNEIFAKYGHDFDTQRIEDYFMQKSWYKRIDGKKISVSDLNKQEQENINKIQKEIELRKTYKDINTIKQPDVENIKNYKAAEVLKDGKVDYYVKIYNNVQDAMNPSINEANVSKVELLPSKIYLMDDDYKFYYTFEGETYYIPVEKVNSYDEERIVLMESNMEIYNNGDLVVDGIKDPNFFNVKALEDSDAYPKYYDNIIEFLVSGAPVSNAFVDYIGLKYNFDNDLNTNEYIFSIAASEFEAGSEYLVTSKKAIYSNKENTSLHIQEIAEVDYSKNIAGYSNLFVRYPTGYGDMEEDYSVKYYGTGTSMLDEYVNENFIDAYYLYVPNLGFKLINRTLDGEHIDLDKYIFTLKRELKFYSKEKYKEEYGDMEWIGYDFDFSKYDRVWYSVNENGEDLSENGHYYMYPNENAIILSANYDVKLANAEGWWKIIFESEDGKEAYVKYYTPAGVT